MTMFFSVCLSVCHQKRLHANAVFLENELPGSPMPMRFIWFLQSQILKPVDGPKERLKDS